MTTPLQLVLDTSAIEEEDEADDYQLATNDFYFGCIGITQSTPKMDRYAARRLVSAFG
jgi:hypothetical protein